MSEGREVDLAAEVAAAWSTFRRRLADRLEQIEEDDLLLLEVQSGTREDELAGCAPYLQFCGWGEGMIRAEAVSDHYLDERYELGDGSAALLEMGWEEPDPVDEPLATPNYWADLHHEDVEQLADMTVRALRDVYGCPHPAFVTSDDFDCIDGRPAVEETAAVAASRAAELAAVQPQSDTELQALVDAALEAMFEGPAEHDSDGDITITCGSLRVFIRVAQDVPAVDIFTYLVPEVQETSEVVAAVNGLNAASVDRQLSVVDGIVLARTRVLAMPFAPAQLRAAVHLFCDGLDDLAEQVATAVGARQAPAREPVPPQPDLEPPLRAGQDEPDAMTALLEVLHEDPVLDPATVTVLVGPDRRAIVRLIVEVRDGRRHLDGLDVELVLGHLRRALRHLADRRAHADDQPRRRRDRSRQLTLLPDEDSLDGGSWDADIG